MMSGEGGVKKIKELSFTMGTLFGDNVTFTELTEGEEPAESGC